MSSARALAAIVFMVAADAGASQSAAGIQRAAWLHGCWEWTTADRSVEESWTAAKGDSMIGVGRTIQNGKTTSYEMIVLREHGDRLAYEAHPSGQASTTFLSTRISASELVFENPVHDFPHEVGYRREGDRLLAWIRGTQDGKERRIEFPYARAQCGNKMSRPQIYAVFRINSWLAVFSRLAWNRSTGRCASTVQPGDSCPHAIHSR
ncbi:MAG: DUF6265 family protein [Vicinamibacterales bacterium]